MQTQNNTKQPAEASIWCQLSMPDYLALDRCSSHRLGLLRQSPAHLRHEILNPTEQTDAMRFGSAVHTAILEPELFDKLYAVAPRVDRRTTVGKETWAAFQLENGHKTAITADDMIAINGIKKAVAANSTAAALVAADGSAEMVGLWTDSATGVQCKMRIDKCMFGLGALLDLKTTNDASRREFERSIFKYGYHRQAAMYLDGCAALGRQIEDYIFVAVEKEAPYALAVYRLSDDIIALGRKENAALMQLYATCQRSNEWLGYPDLIQDIGIPAWAKRQIEEDNAL